MSLVHSEGIDDMLIKHSLATLVALATAVLVPRASSATTVDTFTFTQDGWTTTVINSPTMDTVGTPDPRGILTGSFTGTVEADGLIGRADLTSFGVSYQDSTAGLLFKATSPQALQLFSYNTNGGASSLDFAVNGFGIIAACAGAAASLDATCFLEGFVLNPVGTNGVVLTNSFTQFVTLNFAQLTLQSSVTTLPPSAPAATPEPEPVCCSWEAPSGVRLIGRRRLFYAVRPGGSPRRPCV